MILQDDDLPLTRVSAELRREFPDREVPGYRPIYLAVLDGKIPAEQQGVRWIVKRRNLPVIAVALGIAKADPAAAQLVTA